MHFRNIISKNNIFALLSLALILSAIPFTVWQISRLQNFKSSASEFSLVPYPGLSWSAPHDYTVSVLLHPQTPEETLILSKGSVVTAENAPGGNSIYSFYDALLLSKGFTQVKVTGSPQKDSHWVASYQSQGNFCQVQYYPTPYKDGNFSVLLFFGTLEDGIK